MNNIKFTTYALARSLLALGTLITLLIDGKKILFDLRYLESSVYLRKISIFYIFGYDNLNISIILSIIILLLVIIGVYPRFTGLLHWWVTSSFFYSITLSEGGDQIAVILTLLIMPITLCDSRYNHWCNKNIECNKLVLEVCKILIMIQMSVLYFDASIGKLASPEWRDGTATYYWIMDNSFGHSYFNNNLLLPILKNKWGVVIFTWLPMFIELLLAIGIFISSKKKKVQLLFLGLFFHFSIFITFGLFTFFLAMASGLLLYLLPFDTKLDFYKICKTKLSSKKLKGLLKIH